MRATPPRAYRFADFRIDAAARQLSRSDGTPITLTPKVFETLLYLVEHAGCALTKEELMAGIWPGRVVEENNLNQKISTLRRTLNTPGSGDRFIVTEPGQGYRFVAEVHIESGVTEATVTHPAPAERESSVPEATSRVPRPARVAEWRNASRGWPLAAILGAIAVVAWATGAFWYSRKTPAPSAAASTVPDAPATPGHALIVLPLHAIGDVPDDDAFAQGLTEELISVLARIDGLRVIAHTSATRIQQSGESLASVAQRLGISHALEGSMRHEGDQLRVSLRLTDVASGRTLWAEQYDHAARDVFTLEGDVARSVSAALALKLNAQVQDDLAHEGDPMLYRRYLEARRLARGAPRDAGIAAFHKLIEDAPDYARGHGGLALVLLRSGMPRKAEAVQEAERALALDPELADANAALGFAACQSDEWERGVTLTQRALEQAPADTAIRLSYGICLSLLGYLPAGLEQARMAQAVDPLSDEANLVFASMLDVAGRHDEAATYFAKVPGATSLIWFNAIWRGDFAHAREAIAGQQGRWNVSYAALTDAMEDPAKWPAARMQMEASEQNDGHPDGQRNWAHVLDPQTDVAADIAMLEKVRHLGLAPVSLWQWNRELASHRAHPAFQAYLRRTHIIDYWRVRGWPEQCRPDGDGARCS